MYKWFISLSSIWGFVGIIEVLWERDGTASHE